MTEEVARINAQERKLYDEIAEKLGTPGSKLIRMILERIMTPEQAKIVNVLNPPELGVPEEVAKKLGLSKETVDDVFREMMDKGLVVPSRKGGYYLAGSIIQFHDTMPTKKWCEILGPEYMDLWALYEISERPQQALEAFGFLPSPPFYIRTYSLDFGTDSQGLYLFLPF